AARPRRFAWLDTVVALAGEGGGRGGVCRVSSGYRVGSGGASWAADGRKPSSICVVEHGPGAGWRRGGAGPCETRVFWVQRRFRLSIVARRQARPIVDLRGRTRSWRWVAPGRGGAV